MPNIEMCKGVRDGSLGPIICPIKRRCYRYTAVPDSDQVWILDEKTIPGFASKECTLFYEKKAERKFSHKKRLV